MHTKVNKNVLQKEGNFITWTRLHVYDLCIEKSQNEANDKEIHVHVHVLNSQIIKSQQKFRSWLQATPLTNKLVSQFIHKHSHPFP